MNRDPERRHDAYQPVRVMKARRSSVVSCGHYVTTGATIVKVAGAGWTCLACRLGQLPLEYGRPSPNRVV